MQIIQTKCRMVLCRGFGDEPRAAAAAADKDRLLLLLLLLPLLLGLILLLLLLLMPPNSAMACMPSVPATNIIGPLLWLATTMWLSRTSSSSSSTCAAADL